MDTPWIRRTLLTRKCQPNFDYLEMNLLPRHRPGSEILPHTAAFSFQSAHRICCRVADSRSVRSMPAHPPQAATRRRNASDASRFDSQILIYPNTAEALSQVTWVGDNCETH